MELHAYMLRHSGLKGLSVLGPGHCWAVMPMLLGPQRAGGSQHLLGLALALGRALGMGISFGSLPAAGAS